MQLSERIKIDESAGGDAGVYRRVTLRVINGTPYRFVYRIGFNNFATLTVVNDREGRQVHKYELGRVKAADMPGMVNLSLTLGKLLSF